MFASLSTLALSVILSSGSSVPTIPPAAAVAEGMPAWVTTLAAKTESAKQFNCLFGFSKDACDGPFGGGFGFVAQCPGTDCLTLTVEGAKWAVKFQSSKQKCADNPLGPTGRCDEVGEIKDGVFEAKINFELRLQKPCRYRGCYSGEASYFTNDGSVFIGNVVGTLGIGDERKNQCNSPGTIDPAACESCHGARFDSVAGLWYVAVEGTFQGKRADADTGETLCFTISGEVVAKGDINGPFDPVNGFRFTGNADGIYTKTCF